MKKSNYPKYLFQRYVIGEITAQEKIEFEEWLNKVETREEIPWMKQAWDESSGDELLILGAKERILQQINEQLSPESASVRHSKAFKQIVINRKRSMWDTYHVLRYASIILIILIPIFIYNLVLFEHPPPTAIEYLSKTTHNGQHLTFHLEDGSQITLNSNSELIYPKHFSDSSRTVTLAGEAFFDVAKDAKRPFAVRTRDITTTALGTSFNIKSINDQLSTEISLISGVVRVEMDDAKGNYKDVQLSPGEQLMYSLKDKSFEMRNFDSVATVGWKDGIIHFKNAGLGEIISTLEVWYDVEFSMEGGQNLIKNSDWTYTGDFKNQSLENVLFGIGHVKGFSHEITDKTVVLMFN